jgi:2-polyprenyl-3-methyl-5-hydroxy-6-metoxy-1,4-benzoquinol methylase
MVDARSNQIDRIRAHYGPWARTYGKPDDDGWFSFVRQREIRLIWSMLKLRPGESVLDAGCGTGELARQIKERGHEVWAVDCTPEMVAQVEGKVDRALVVDLNEMDLGRRFDAILCIGALEFAPQPERVLARLRAHLEDHGRLIVLAPRNGPGGWIYGALKRRHQLDTTLFSPRSLARAAASCGLRVVEHRMPFIHNIIATLEVAR